MALVDTPEMAAERGGRMKKLLFVVRRTLFPVFVPVWWTNEKLDKSDVFDLPRAPFFMVWVNGWIRDVEIYFLTRELRERTRHGDDGHKGNG